MVVGAFFLFFSFNWIVKNNWQGLLFTDASSMMVLSSTWGLMYQLLKLNIRKGTFDLLSNPRKKEKIMFCCLKYMKILASQNP